MVRERKNYKFYQILYPRSPKHGCLTHHLRRILTFLFRVGDRGWNRWSRSFGAVVAAVNLVIRLYIIKSSNSNCRLSSSDH